MAMRVLEAVRTSGGGLLAAVPAFGQAVTEQEIVNELESRNFTRGMAPLTPVPTPPPATPTITRAEAVIAGTTSGLTSLNYPTQCVTVGGCYIKENSYDYIVRVSVYYANLYLTQGYIQAPTVGPIADSRLGAYRGLGFGQLPNAIAPDPSAMTTSEKLSLAFNILAGGLTTAATYLQGKAERDRLAQMQQAIPALTAAQVQRIINQAVGAGLTDKSTAQNVAAGLFGQPAPKPMPSWMLPAFAAGAAVVVMLAMRK